MPLAPFRVKEMYDDIDARLNEHDEDQMEVIARRLYSMQAAYYRGVESESVENMRQEALSKAAEKKVYDVMGKLLSEKRFKEAHLLTLELGRLTGFDFDPDPLYGEASPIGKTVGVMMEAFDLSKEDFEDDPLRDMIIETFSNEIELDDEMSVDEEKIEDAQIILNGRARKVSRKNPDLPGIGKGVKISNSDFDDSLRYSFVYDPAVDSDQDWGCSKALGAVSERNSPVVVGWTARIAEDIHNGNNDFNFSNRFSQPLTAKELNAESEFAQAIRELRKELSELRPEEPEGF